ncbi:filamentous hemagglutinin family protein [Orrella sp. JC864]|uniref:filamentous haemagglutinin family protein n=1 Tax=Orrella sp. JC864 TaxID=3120298 RepID=UPI00300A2260
MSKPVTQVFSSAMSSPHRRLRPGSPRLPRPTPLAQALAVALLAGAAALPQDVSAHAGGGAWFAAGAGAGGQARAAQRAPAPGATLPTSARQQAQAREQLSRSIANLNRTANAIAAQQAAQEQARNHAQNAAWVRDGLGADGLDPLAGGRWDAAAPETGVKDGRQQVTIAQDRPRAILEWNSFHVGRNTDLTFRQASTDAVLNKVMGDARPSQIQGSIRADGTVMIANQNGVVFTGSSQVNVRNLVAAAAATTGSQGQALDAQFLARGLYSEGGTPTFQDALGNIEVQAGARLATHAPASSTSGGGYVLLAGKQVQNAGTIHTPRGQALLAAGDSFVIARGQGTEGNPSSTTRGNEVTAAGSGIVANTGLIQSPQGDITLAGTQVRQLGVAVATSSQDLRGTIHLRAAGADGQVLLGRDSATAIVLADTDATALDGQRDSLQAPVVDNSQDNIVRADDFRRDLSLVRIESGGTVDFEGGSLTLATGGQIAVNAARRALVREGAVLDVSGAVGVRVAMESNNLQINVQGNEQRDAPVNRDSGQLNNSNIWVDRRSLVHVPAGTNGYEGERWYTAGGLLEVGGYLATSGRGVGEWMAQGGAVQFTGGEVVTQAGSSINLSGGTLDVQSGMIRQSWLRGADGRLYEVSRAPGDMLYAGMYQGYERHSERWGQTDHYYNPLVAPGQRREPGYTVGRDAGVLVIGTGHAVLEGEIASDTYQGPRQDQAPQAGLDGYYQSQRALARGAQLVVGRYTPYYVKDSGTLQHGLGADANTIREVVLGATGERIAAGLSLDDALPADRQGRLYLDTEQLNGFGLGAVRVAAAGGITVEAALSTAPGGEITLFGPRVEVSADLSAHGGMIRLGNVLNQVSANRRIEDTTLAAPAGTRAGVTVAEGVTIDAGGLWSNLLLDPANIAYLPYRDGGTVSVRSSGDVMLGAGSLVDVAAGAAVLADGTTRGGRGGNATLAANAASASSAGVLSLDGEIRGYGVTGSGTLAILAGRVRIGGAHEAVEPGELHLPEDFFGKGFSRYQVIGNQGMAVAPHAQVEVTMPVYRFAAAARDVPTGHGATQALEAWTPPRYLQDPAAGVLTQRGGASLSLQAGSALSSIAERSDVLAQIGLGAAVTVDPGQAIEIRSIGQLTVLGTLNAWGGRIDLGAVDERLDAAGHGRSVWIGEQAVLDVAGRAATAVDLLGKRYGIVQAGGEIVIGGAFDAESAQAGRPNALTQSHNADDVFVVVRPGALLDASGASAVLDIPGRGAVAVASAGGAITLASSNGLYVDGTLRAGSGGAGAAGGSLTLALDTPLYRTADAGARVRRVRELALVREAEGSGLPTDAGQAAGLLQYGHGQIAASQVAAGGFDSLTLASDGVLSLGGDVRLALGQSLSLYASVLTPGGDAPDSARIELAAPYVRLAGYVGRHGADGYIHPTVVGGLSAQAAAGSLQIQAGQLLDLGGVLYMGGRSQAATVTGLPEFADRRAFDSVRLESGGDMRLLGGEFYSPGDLALAAAQLYPATQANAVVYAGWNGTNADFAPGRTLTIARTTESMPGMPYSVFGRLRLAASTVDQGGVVRAPLGSVVFGSPPASSLNTMHLNLLDGSVTSVSANGLLMPYGGSIDAVAWTYAGQQVSLSGAASQGDAFVELRGRYVDVQEGALIDLSGGGTLTGAGFVSGRGGSTDARYHPLAQVGRDGLVLPGLGSNPVYAIVPGMQAPAAPAGGERGPSQAMLGQQVTLAAGAVPGLPAGTYTLLPATYSLLPGAYRVEINGAAGPVGAPGRTGLLRNGSYAAEGVLSVAGTHVRDSLPSRLILTPADTLRRYSQYNETSYADFVRADAATRGVPRAVIEADAKNLLLSFADRNPDDERLSLRFDGTVLGGAAQGGRGSTLAVLAIGQSASAIEVLGQADAPGPDSPIAVRAAELTRLQVDRLAIGGMPWVVYGQAANMVRLGNSTGAVITGRNPAGGVTVRSGAVLSAPEVMLISKGNLYQRDGTIVIEQGAQISTLGQGASAFDATHGFVHQPADISVVAVSNGALQWLAPQAGSSEFPGAIQVGTCAVGSCAGQTRLYSEGSIAFVTDNRFELDDSVLYGTRHLSLAVGAFNIGGAQALAAAQARGALTPGLTINQQIMERLLQGDANAGAPALETLELIAGRSLNFFDSVTLSTLDADGRSLLDNLLLTTSAVYGYGGAGDLALIRTGRLFWNGASQAPGAVAAGGAGTGSGALQIEAAQIIFGYGPWGRPDGVSELDRLALGFASVNLHASERISANNAGTLAVYQAQGEYVAGEGYRHDGGDLNVITPLWTGESGSVSRITAGGAITVAAPASGAADPSSAAELGAELALTAGRGLALDTAVALPSGRLTLAAEGDVALGGRAHLDLSGRSVTFFDDQDATQYSWGGDAILRSAAGDVRLAAGSIVDVSARYNQAGRLSVLALGEAAGAVDLQGLVRGAASGYYEAGGSWAPYQGGAVEIRAQRLDGGADTSAAFAALNQRLNEGEVFGRRSFQLKQGDLRIGNELRAGQIEVSVDGGHLTVAGTVDASGERVGSIRLAGGQGLTLDGNAVLDAHGTMLRIDSYGQVIDAPNRAVIELNSGQGLLTLAAGSRMDLRYGTDDARVRAHPALHDGRARGTVELFAPRIDAGGNAGTAQAAVHGDVAIQAQDGLRIEGARSIAVNAVQRHDDAPYGTEPAAGGKPYQVIDQAYLDARHAQSAEFIARALANGALREGRLAGLDNAAYGQVLHLRPGVEIVSATADGDIVVGGDLDLSGHRYDSLNPGRQRTAVHGSGEPGALAIRAGGDLHVYGSINDGFAPPPDTPDDNGWVLTPGLQAYGGDVVVPGPGVGLAAGTRFPPGKVLNYDLPIREVALAAGTELPAAAVLAADLRVPAGTVLGGAVRDADGHVMHAAGTVLREAAVLPAGTRLDPGFTLPAAATLAAMVWPAGAPLPHRATSQSSTNPDGVFLSVDLQLPVGALIPSMTDVRLIGDVPSVALRAASGGRMGRNWAVAAMLPEDSLSWSLRLVAGSDTGAADPRLTRPQADGSLVLADTHYGLYEQRERTVIPGTPPQPGGAWYWNELGELIFGSDGAVAGTPVPPGWESVCADGLCDRVSYVWNELGALFGFEAGTPVPPEWESLCADGLCVSLGEPIPGTPDRVVIGEIIKRIPVAQNFSVLRTGTGDLDLLAAGDFVMRSLYGVYTAGTSTASRAGAQAAAFDRDRGRQADGTYLGTGFTPELPDNHAPPGPAYESVVDRAGQGAYAAWYPDGGGNLLLRAGGNLAGDMHARYNPVQEGQDLRPQRSSVDLGNWLWRQGSGDTAGIEPIATSWWINFGTYVPGSAVSNTYYGLSNAERSAVAAIPELVGFTGLGTLGGGNLSIEVDGAAGLIERRGSSRALGGGRLRSEGLAVAVAGTGRVLDGGELLLTGGGDLRLQVGGGLNPGLQARADAASPVGAESFNAQEIDLTGVLANLRGSVHLQAAQAGGVALGYTRAQTDSRPFDPYTASRASSTGGPVLMLGDAVATLATRGDLVVSGTGDPGRVALPYSLPYVSGGAHHGSGGQGWFSLWTDNTAIRLFSAGGDLTPSVQLREVTTAGAALTGRNHSATDGRFLWPGQLRIVAAGGSVFLGQSALGSVTPTSYNAAYSLLLSPFGNADLQILAADSIYASGYVVSRSAAPAEVMPTPLNPAFAVFSADGFPARYNLAHDAIRPSTSRFSLFAFGPNTALEPAAGAYAPARIYALGGDIVGLGTGEILAFGANTDRPGQTWYEGAGPVWMRAGRDIVRSGSLIGGTATAPGEIAAVPSSRASTSSTVRRTGNLFIHGDPTDVSVVQAGRDILFSNFNVAGPGTLEVSAGRHIVMAGPAEGGAYAETGIRSLGPVAVGDARPGAEVAIQAGLGEAGADYAGFLERYLDPSNLADPSLPLAEQPGKVAKTYEAELIAWLAERYGFEAPDGDAAEAARAYFDGLAPAQQRIFARRVYFAELRAGGREYNDADGPRFGSYLRGRNAIAALFPEHDAAGQAIVYQGDLLMYGGSGIHTDVGGSIQVLTPGGSQTYGVEGEAPPATAGLITRGVGDIQLYSLGSILLGQSRIMTTFGGDILAWSAVGDINAGRGSKTTVVYTPPRRVYDAVGNVTLSSDVPSTGAGIATLDPIPEVPPGDVDLIAPLGTIDAGEAGIRVSGNVNIAALQVVNAANIQVQGEAAGIPVVAAVNVGALTSASAASTAAADAAQESVARTRAAARQNLPSIISVQILGFGDEPAAGGPAPGGSSPGASAAPAARQVSYRSESMLQVVGEGDLSEAQRARLTPGERQRFGL